MTRGAIDCIVIGAGVVGTSTAWHLAESGATCMVFDKKGIGSGATAIQPGGVRTQWSSEVTCRMALESYDFYTRVSDRLKPSQDPFFDPCGYVFAASNQTTLTEIQTRVEVQARLGVSSEMLTAEEIGELVPGLDHARIVGGSFNPADGYFKYPGSVVTAFADAAQRAGAKIQVAAVERLVDTTRGWTVLLDDGRSVIAERVVVAAGVETADIVRTVGYDLPITSQPKYLFFSNPIKPFLVRPLVVFEDEHFAVKHLEDGSVLASDLRHGASGERDESVWRREVTAKARTLVPLLEHVRYPVMVEGAYDVTPDTQLVIGPVPEHPGLMVAAGMNGRGMMLAPSVGRLVSQAVSGSTTAIPEELLPVRFRDERKHVGERQVI